MKTYFDIPYSSDSNPRLCVDVFTPDSIPCRAAVYISVFIQRCVTYFD